jgi:exoribonuclease R
VREGLQALPAAMANGTRKANTVERGVLDLAEALVLQGREGERFYAVVIDEGVVQLADPAVRAKIDGDPELGAKLEARLVKADPKTHTVTFAV